MIRNCLSNLSFENKFMQSAELQSIIEDFLDLLGCQNLLSYLEFGKVSDKEVCNAFFMVLLNGSLFNNSPTQSEEPGAL